MCYYCRYLAHEKSVHYNDNDHSNIYSSYKDVRTSSNHRSCHLLAITLFFVMLNMTIVLCQSSQIQQQDPSSSKILGKNQLTFSRLEKKKYISLS